MKPYRLPLHSFTRPAIAKGLILTFITLLSLPASAPANSARKAEPIAPLATTITVNLSNDADALNPAASCDTDAATPGDQCSLRSAIQHANELAGDDEINFNIPSSQPLCDPTVGRCTINLTKALPNLSTNIRIVSPGIDLIVVRRSVLTEFGIFRVILGSDVTLSRLRIENGKPPGIAAGGAVSHEGTGIVNVVDSIITDNFGGTIVSSGGAIANSSTGTLNVINSVVSDNQVNASGGGLNNGNSGTMNVIGSAVLRNTVNTPGNAGSVGNGGGLSNSGIGTLNITNSVIAENRVIGGDGTSVMRGGGVMNVGNGTININGSVIHDNFVQKQGGGISNTSGTVHITNSTITKNRGIGGGIFGNATLKSSIVAKNNDGPFSGSDVLGEVVSEGFNLIGVEDGSTGFTAPTDIKGTVTAPAIRSSIQTSSQSRFRISPSWCPVCRCVVAPRSIKATATDTSPIFAAQVFRAWSTIRVSRMRMTALTSVLSNARPPAWTPRLPSTTRATPTTQILAMETATVMQSLPARSVRCAPQ